MAPHLPRPATLLPAETALPAPCQLRPWRDSDSLAELTALLHGACAPLAATDVQARDWPGARALLADQATLHWPASGEHLLDADAINRVNAVYPEGWALHILEVTPMQDGRVHSMVAVRHGAQRLLAHTLWRFDGRLIARADETWATVQAPPDWRNAATLGAYRRDEAEPPAADPGLWSSLSPRPLATLSA